MHFFKFSLILAILFHSGSAFCKESYEQIVKREIAAYMQEKDIPGIAVALYYEGKSELYNFGVTDKATKSLITPATLFQIASITKVFTATALAVEVEKGKMALNDPVAKYLPKMPLGLPLDQITLQELATHTSSLPRDPGDGKRIPSTQEEVMTFLKNWTPSYTIGSRYVYSNLGFGVLGYALADLERKPYYEVLQTLILNPLGMYSTFINIPPPFMQYFAQGYTKEGRIAVRHPPNAWPAGGALRSTSADMLKYLKANLGVSGPIELQKAMQFAQQGLFKAHKNLVIGLGWQRFTTKKGELFIDKDGGVPGFSSYIGMVPEKKIGIVILANKGKGDITATGRKILELLLNP